MFTHYLPSQPSRLFLLALAASLAAAHANAQTISSFTDGDLVVYTTSSSSALSSAASAVFLEEYTPAGAFVGSMNVSAAAITDSTQLTASGTASSEGQITFNGQDIALTGYTGAIGTAGIAGTTSTADPRIAATVGLNGSFNFISLGTTPYSGNNIRGAYASSSSTVWTVGAGSGSNGVWYANGSTPVNLITGGLRAVDAFNGQLFINTGTTIQSLGSGLPTSGTQTATTLATLTGSSPAGNAFVMFDLGAGPTQFGENTIYVANDAGSSANTTAIEKFSYTGSAWVNTGDIGIGSIGSSTVGALGLTGEDIAGTVVLYGTSSNGSNGTIFTATDSSGYDGTASGTATSLAVAGADQGFRGLVIVPEPSSIALTLGAAALALAARRPRSRFPS
jgi:hypothetical protein